MSAAVLLPAVLVVLCADRRFLAFADHRHAARRHAQIDQVVLHGARATGAEREVVLRAAARVAMTFDLHLAGGPFLQPVGILLEMRLRVFANLRLIEVEVRVVELAGQLLQ